MKYVIASLLVLVAGTLFLTRLMSPAALPDYIVLISACDEPVGILIASEPPTLVSRDFPPSDVQEASIEAAIDQGRFEFLAIECAVAKTRT